MIRVLIAEDSASVRAYLEYLIKSAADMEVVAVVSNGEEAAQLTCELKPDVVAMDIHMPVMDGYSATRRIMAQCPTPVVIVSSLIHGSDARETFRIMEVGALAAVPKPPGPGSAHAQLEAAAFIGTLREMAGVKVAKPVVVAPPVTVHAVAKKTSDYRLVVIGSSTGGPVALQSLLRELPVDFPLPIVIVQHISVGFIAGMVKWLSQSCALPVFVANAGETVQAGRVYFAPDGAHLGINRQGVLSLNYDPPFHSVRPAVSYLFGSAAQHYGKRAIGVMLTGMGRDGAQEMLAMKNAGAVTLVQDQASCVVYGMPGAAAQLGVGDYHLPPEKIGQQLVALAAK
jgi:two-component system chemotaxis response regulator CheB